MAKVRLQILMDPDVYFNVHRVALESKTSESAVICEIVRSLDRLNQVRNKLEKELWDLKEENKNLRENIENKRKLITKLEKEVKKSENLLSRRLSRESSQSSESPSCTSSGRKNTK